jgi:hypothetical protein
MNFLKPLSSPIEKILKIPILFSVLVMYQGLFSHHGTRVPERLLNLFEYPMFRLFSLFIIALVVTSNVEYAIISTLIFIATMYGLKTPEERKKYGFI